MSIEQKTKRILAWSKPQFNEVMEKMGISDKNVEKTLSDVALISINDTHGQWSVSWFDQDHSNVIRLWFDDVEQDTDKFSPTNQEKVKAFTIEDAKAIRDFIKKNKKQNVFIIHCSAGIARSGACAQFICDYFQCDREEFKRANPYILPNQRVVRMLNNITIYKNYKF
jgi:predicted protein tyrosine phosphatase